MDAQDALLAAKVNQAYYANQDRALEIEYKKGDMVLMSTENRRRAYKSKGDGRVAKFMPRFDGPYEVVEAHPETSTYTLKLLFSDVKQDGFHGRLLRPWRPNNPELFPDRQLPKPGPTLNKQGEPEWEVEEIIERHRHGKGFQYLVQYRGYGPEDDRWLPGSEVEELEAMDRWLEKTEGREKVLEVGGV
jgi:Chromo (CHRromatin Organisation MOdifier) domain